MLFYHAESHYAECCILFSIMLNVVMLDVVMLSVVAPYLLTLANRKDAISVVLPKVAKASTIVTVACHCRWRYHLKYIANAHKS